MMSRTPLDWRILIVAVPAAPTPVTTTRIRRRSFFTIWSALSSAARTTTAVPCWSSWITGISRSRWSRCFEIEERLQRDLEAAWRRDVLEVDPAEHGRDRLHDRHDLVHVLGRQAQREGVDPGELLEDERFALHHRLGGARADVAETEHRGAVRHDRDGVLLDRQRVRFLGVVVDGHADARDARRVGHGEVVAGLDAHLPAHLDLPAQVHEERAVRDVDDLHALDRADPVHDLLAVGLVARLERDVARDRRLADDDQIDGADVAAGLTDRRGDPTEHAGLVQDLEPDRETVAGAWRLHSGPSLPRCTRPFAVLTRRATPTASARVFYIVVGGSAR